MYVGSVTSDSSFMGFAHTFSARETSSAFASQVMNRISGVNELENNASKQISSSGAENQSLNQNGQGRSAPSPETAAKLESALSGSIDYLTEKFGDAAGTAAMGIILQRLGSGPVTEESLGNAFLGAVKFVDQQFGVDQGDGFINQLNGDLNEGLNSFFDNGLSEKFLASTTPLGSAALGGTALKATENQGGASLAADLKSMLEELKDSRSDKQITMTEEAASQYDKYVSSYFEAPILEPGLLLDTQV